MLDDAPRSISAETLDDTFICVSLRKTSTSTYGVADKQGIYLKAKLTHQEMANLIGCSRETVSATLGQF